MQTKDPRAHPLLAVLVFLATFTIVFPPLHGRLGDAAFIICNLMPLFFASLFGLRWGMAYAVIHGLHGILMGGWVGVGFERFVTHGIPATLVTIALSGGIGRIRDLTTKLKRELGMRHESERELQDHRVRLELLVEERTADLMRINEQLRQEIAEREKAEAEKQQLEASLKRAEKMEAIGVLAGSVAHDLNNILSSLIIYPELMLLDLPGDSPLRESLVSIQEAGQRAAAVVDDLLAMARRGVTVRETLNLNDVVSSLIRSAELSGLRARHPDVHIEARLDSGLLNTLGSAMHLNRAVLNLVLNSMEAFEEGHGRIVISTSNVYVDTPGGNYEILQEGEYVTLSVADDGVGIPAEDLDRIFEPFYTKKQMGRSGTGLGMAIVWGTVKDHDGFIDVHSAQGRGTTVTLFLPASREHVRAATSGVSIEDYLGQGESVLVVDDVKMQRELCAAILDKLGYEATVVGSGEEAISHVAEHPVDLVILDMIMEPGLDGLETYRRIVEIKPGQRAIIASGFSETDQVNETQALGAGAYLRKPYTLDRMAVALREELGRISSSR